jgi:hypothetical protein
MGERPLKNQSSKVLEILGTMGERPLKNQSTLEILGTMGERPLKNQSTLQMRTIANLEPFTGDLSAI